eukprot:scaffold49988_cov36-Tisochrysis_lutea.AAC.3
MGLGEGNHYGESQPGLPQGDRAEHLGVSGRCCTRGASPTVKPIQTLCTQMSSLIGLSMAPRCPRRSAIYSQNSRKPTRFIHRHPRTSCSSTRKRCALDVPVIGSGMLRRWPNLGRKQREEAILQEHPAVFIIGIGHPLADGRPHEVWGTKRP